MPLLGEELIVLSGTRGLGALLAKNLERRLIQLRVEYRGEFESATGFRSRRTVRTSWILVQVSHLLRPLGVALLDALNHHDSGAPPKFTGLDESR